MTSHDFWPSIIEKVKEENALYNSKNIWATLRQMFYRLVSRKALPNTRSMYNQLSAQTARSRESKDEDSLPINCFRDDSPIFDIEDEYHSPEQVIDGYIKKLKDLPKNYKGLPKWYNQPDYTEDWIEKSAMGSEFKSIIDNEGLEIRLVPHGGYVSLTQLNDSVDRIFRMVKKGKKRIHINYFGDFDPSGVQMFDDIKSRLARIWGLENSTKLVLELEGKVYKFSFELRRVAVNKNHVLRYDLPKDPQSENEEIKLENDTRTEGFKEKHGRVYATELDTLPVVVPDVFEDMVVQSVNEHFDQEIYDREVAAHEEEHSQEAIEALVKRKIDEFADELANPNND